MSRYEEAVPDVPPADLTLTERIRDAANVILRSGGTDWRQAILRAGAMLEVSDPLRLLGNDAAGNWLWLGDWPTSERALDVGGGPGDTAAALASLFSEVDYLDHDAGWVEFARHRFGTRASPRVRQGGVELVSAQPGSFGCISITATTRRPDSESAGMLADCHRLLAPGGLLRLIPRIPVKQEGVSRIRTLVDQVVSGELTQRAWGLALRQAGYRPLGTYYAEPSLSYPYYLMPGNRRAVRAAERLHDDHLAGGRSRGWIVRAGLHGALYRHYFLLATK